MSKSKKTQTATSDRISQQLRTIIEADGRTVYAIAKESGVSAGMIHRFLAGERTLRLDTVDELAKTLGLNLIRTAPSHKG